MKPASESFFPFTVSCCMLVAPESFGLIVATSNLEG